MNRTFTTTELDTLTELFGDWTWGPHSIEPDGRITVLIDEADRGAARWLVREDGGWAWSDSHGNVAGSDPWDAIQRWMSRDPGRKLRIPDRQELVEGGWTIEDNDAHETPVEDEAGRHIDQGFWHLNRPTVDGLVASRAMAHFLGAIAISLHELVTLHKKYDIDNLQVVVDSGPVQEQEKRAAAGNPEQPIREPEDGPGSGFGPVTGEDFPFAR